MQSEFKTFTICLVFLDHFLVFTSAMPEQIVVKMARADVFNAIDSVMESSYIKQLAKEFASRAAERFIDEIKRRQFFDDLTRLGKQHNRNSGAVYEGTPRPQERSKILDEAQAKILSENPYVDGDNLDPLGEQALSDAEVEEQKSKPLAKLNRINGAYFRRLLGYLVKNKGFVREIIPSD